MYVVLVFYDAQMFIIKRRRFIWLSFFRSLLGPAGYFHPLLQRGEARTQAPSILS